MHTFVDGTLLTAAQLNDSFEDIDRRTNLRLNALEADTGWIRLNMTATWNANSNFYYRKIGREVYLRGGIQQSGDLAIGQYNGIATIPSSVRPDNNCFIPIVAWNNGSPVLAPLAVIRVDANTGGVNAYISAPCKALELSGSWPL